MCQCVWNIFLFFCKYWSFWEVHEFERRMIWPAFIDTLQALNGLSRWPFPWIKSAEKIRTTTHSWQLPWFISYGEIWINTTCSRTILKLIAINFYFIDKWSLCNENIVLVKLSIACLHVATADGIACMELSYIYSLQVFWDWRGGHPGVMQAH